MEPGGELFFLALAQRVRLEVDFELPTMGALSDESRIACYITFLPDTGPLLLVPNQERR